MQKILVIDDNNDIRENIAEILELAGYQVVTAENGKRGVESAIKEKPAVIICDIMMPELDGYGVLHLLRKNSETQSIPFIFLTAKTERSDLRRGMEMGADDYITKPFEEIELLNAIEIRLKKMEILNSHYATSPAEVNRFFSDVKDAGLIDRFAAQYDVQEYSRKSAVYAQGKRPRYLYYLVKGKVKTFRLHEDGKEYITNLHSAGEFFGYGAILKDSAYEDSTSVMEDAEIMEIPKDDFLQMVNNDLSIASKFIQIMSQNVKEKEERLMHLAYSSLRKRVARALIEISDKFDYKSPAHPVEISREEIAQYVGTATESLIRTLSDFKAESLIEIRGGKIILNDTKKLQSLLY